MDPLAMITGVKTALDLATVIKNCTDDIELKTKTAELHDAIINLQNGIMSIQAENISLLGEIQEIKEKLTQFESWEAEKKNYEIFSIDDGVYVYRPTSNQNHKNLYMCPKCFQEKKLYMLTADYVHSEGASFTCPECKNVFRVDKTSEFGSHNIEDYDPLL